MKYTVRAIFCAVAVLARGLSTVSAGFNKSLSSATQTASHAAGSSVKVVRDLAGLDQTKLERCPTDVELMLKTQRPIVCSDGDNRLPGQEMTACESHWSDPR
jgi:hypothetical protein